MRMGLNGGKIKRAKASREGSQISHLLFAINSILFRVVTKDEVEAIKTMLKEYEVCSKQSTNFNKSTLFFSTNTSKDDQQVVSSVLGFIV